MAFLSFLVLYVTSGTRDTQIRLGLEADCMPYTKNSKGQDKRVSESALHGGVKMAGRVVFAEELTYIHVWVDEAGDHWAKLFMTNQDEETSTRAAITPLPEGQTAGFARLRIGLPIG